MEYTAHELDQMRNRRREDEQARRIAGWTGQPDASPFLKLVSVSKCIRDAENEMYNERKTGKRKPRISRKTLS